MIDHFESLKSLIKPQTVTIDNFIYRLHYRATAVLLLTFSLLVSLTQYFGNPISCLVEEPLPEKIINTFCWIETTFSLEKAWKDKVGVDIVYPGIDKYSQGDKQVYHQYYQWIGFVLFFQALMFYIPRYLWKIKENGLIKSLKSDLDNPTAFDENSQEHLELLSKYLFNNLYNNSSYFSFYFFTELLNFFNIIIQIYFTNKLLNSEFTLLGWNLMKFDNWSNHTVAYDPLVKVFPRMSKCRFFDFGSSGTIQKYDILCLLPINILNEKIYLFLWFWFWFIFYATLLGLIYRCMIISMPLLRYLSTHSKCFTVNSRYLDYIIRKVNIGDWFILDLLSKNIDRHNFNQLIIMFHDKINNLKVA